MQKEKRKKQKKAKNKQKIDKKLNEVKECIEKKSSKMKINF